MFPRCILVAAASLFLMGAGLEISTKRTGQAPDAACDINVYFLVDTSSSIGGKTSRYPDSLKPALRTVFQTLLFQALKRGGRVVVSGFDTTAETVPSFAEGLITNSDDALTYARSGTTHLMDNIGGSTCLLCGFQEVLAKKNEHSNTENKRNLIFVLTDGEPNTWGSDLPRKSARDLSKAELFERFRSGGFGDLFADGLTEMQFVLFGDAATPRTEFTLEDFFDDYPEVTITKVPSIDETNQAKRDLLEALAVGGCNEPEWATIYFENDSPLIYDYRTDKFEIKRKYRKFWHARGGEEMFAPAANPHYYIAAFASLRGNPAYNVKLSKRRVQSATCVLAQYLFAQDELRENIRNNDPFKFTVVQGSFGDKHAVTRKYDSETAQKVDRKVHIYFGTDFIMDFQSFKRGLMDTIVCSSETWKDPDDECRKEIIGRCFKDEDTKDAWHGEHYWKATDDKAI